MAVTITANTTTRQVTVSVSTGSGGGGSMTNAEVKTAYEANADTNAFTDAEQSKLAAIEANATADQTGSEIVTAINTELGGSTWQSGGGSMTDAQVKTAYENNADTNAFTDAEQSKLAAIESNATADQTGAEIKALYEAEADTNAFTDALLTKLNGIDAGAADDQTGTEIIAAIDGEIGTDWKTGGTLENTHKDLHFPATRLIPRVTDGATLGTVESNGLTFERMAFSVAGNEQGAVLNFVLPDDYVAGTELKCKLHMLTNNATSGAVTWGIKCVAYADGVSAYPSLGNEVLISETIINGGDTVQRTVTSVGLDIPGTPGPGKTVYVQVVLKTTSAADCNLLSLTLQYEATRQSLTTYIVPTDSSAPTAPVIVENSETSDGGTYTISTPSTHPVYAINYQFVVDGVAYGSLFTSLTPTLTGLADGSYSVQIRAVAIVPGGANIGGPLSNAEPLTVSSVYVPPLGAMTRTDRGCWWMNRELITSTNAFRISRDSDSAEVDVPWSNGTPDTSVITTHSGGSLPVSRGRVGDLRLVTVYDQSAVGLNIDFSAGTAAPELHYDPATGQFFAVFDGATVINGRINENPNYTIPQPALWFTGVRGAAVPGSTLRVRSSFATTNEHHLSQYATSGSLAGAFGIHAGGSVLYATTSTVGSDALYTQFFNGASSYLMTNGTQEATGDVGAESHEDMFVGSSSNGTAQLFAGDWFGDMCVSGLSNTDRDSLNTTLIADLT